MWRSCLVVVLTAVSGSLPVVAPTTVAARAEAPGYLNPALVRVGQVPGQIVDVSQARILYFGTAGSPGALDVLDRASGRSVAVPPVPGRGPVHGWLIPGGVVFSAEGADVTTARVYEWDGGPDVIDLGPLNSADSVVVRGSYLIWNDAMTLYERDVASGQTVVVATDAGNWENDLLPTGEVVYWTEGSYRIMRYQDGRTVQVSPDTPGRWNTYPITDGSNVVYRRSAPYGLNYRIVLNHGGSETQLTPPTPTSSTFEPAPGWDYDAAGGWTAFQQLDSTGSRLQTWLRDPDGTTSQLPDIASTGPGAQAIVGLNAAGQVMYAAGQSLYLGQTGRPSVLLASASGAWQNHRSAGQANFATYLGQQWDIAMGDSLYVLSSLPFVTLTITVQGHGTVSVAPYGASCRGACSVQYSPGGELDLTATADRPGWRFTRWQGACSGTSVTCQLRLDTDTSVSAAFHPADTTAPATSAPATRLRPGSQLSAGIPPDIPVTTSWAATDPDDPVRQQELQVSVNGGGYAPVSLSSADAGQAASTVVPTAQYEFRARATDSHGNLGDWTDGPPFTVGTAQETAATYTGAWTEHHSRTAWGGTTISTTSAAAAATISTDGQQFAVVGPTGPRNGPMRICVDGNACQTIPTVSSSWVPRVILADFALTPGSHAISITLAPKSGGEIELDGFIAFQGAAGRSWSSRRARPCRAPAAARTPRPAR